MKSTLESVTPFALKDHTLDAPRDGGRVRVEERAVLGPQGETVPGLCNVWITLDNPSQLNSYTTDMVKDVILAFRRASCTRNAVAVVFTGAGTRAFCTGGNTREYAEYYAGRPEEYRQYMRLFNDMVTAILQCDKPVICRVNGLRIAGGQEIGMACDFSIASDLAAFGQAGPKHGSAPDGGSTDFLPLFVGIELAMASCTLCETWTAHEAYRHGLLTDLVPVLRVDGAFVPNPMVDLEWTDASGRIIHGRRKSGAAAEGGRATLERGTIDLRPLDQAVEGLATKLLQTMPGCLTKTLESVRKHKLEHWDRNRESNRAWLGLNMTTEAHAGFRAFNAKDRVRREIDFVALRQAVAAGRPFDGELIEAIQPGRSS